MLAAAKHTSTVRDHPLLLAAATTVNELDTTRVEKFRHAMLRLAWRFDCRKTKRSIRQVVGGETSTSKHDVNA
jgi:hypothetical protein